MEENDDGLTTEPEPFCNINNINSDGEVGMRRASFKLLLDGWWYRRRELSV